MTVVKVLQKGSEPFGIWECVDSYYLPPGLPSPLRNVSGFTERDNPDLEEGLKKDLFRIRMKKVHTVPGWHRGPYRLPELEEGITSPTDKERVGFNPQGRYVIQFYK